MNAALHGMAPPMGFFDCMALPGDERIGFGALSSPFYGCGASSAGDPAGPAYCTDMARMRVGGLMRVVDAPSGLPPHELLPAFTQQNAAHARVHLEFVQDPFVLEAMKRLLNSWQQGGGRAAVGASAKDPASDKETQQRVIYWESPNCRRAT